MKTLSQVDPATHVDNRHTHTTFMCTHTDARDFSQPDQFQEEEIPASKVLEFDDLDFGDEIGQGAFSWVYSGRWKDREVAIKKLSFEALEVEDFLIMFKKEVRRTR